MIVGALALHMLFHWKACFLQYSGELEKSLSGRSPRREGGF